MTKFAVAKQSSNFNLKNVSVELVPTKRASARMFMSVADLEAMRTMRRAIPASKHGRSPNAL